MKSPGVTLAVVSIWFAAGLQGHAQATAPAVNVQSALPAPGSLDDVLQRLEANNVVYERKVPNLYASEHVISQLQKLNVFPGSEVTETDSLFRLRRGAVKGGRVSLDEAREVRRVNGKVQTGGSASLDGPSILLGVFSSGLNLVSVRGSQCFKYVLLPARGREKNMIVIGFENKPEADYGKECPVFEKTSGRAVIDPASMHVVHLEKMTPHHELFAGTFGKWKWAADYAPVSLNGQTFYLPLSITSRADYEPPPPLAGSGSMSLPPNRGFGGTGLTGPLVWTFTATYKDFHLLTATSRLLDGDQSETPKH